MGMALEGGKLFHLNSFILLFVFLVPSLAPLKPQRPYDPKDHHAPIEV